LGEPLSIGILVSGPLIGASWDTTGGSALLCQEMGWADARYSWWRSRRWDLAVSLAAGVHHLNAQGAARLPLQSRSDDIWSFAGVMGMHAHLQITSNAALGLTLRAIATSPKVGVAVGDETTVLQWPLLSASAGLLVGF